MNTGNLQLTKDVKTMEQIIKLDFERGKRLRELREFRNLSQDQLADLIDVSQGAIQKIESGGNSKFFIKIAEALNCDVNWLFSGEGASPFFPSNQLTMYSLPILSWKDVVECEAWTDAFKSQIKERVPMEKQYNNCYVIPIKDDLMVSSDPSEKSFKPGEKIVFNTALVPVNGDYVIVHEKGASEAMLKKFAVAGNKKYLLTHKLIPAIEMDEHIKIIGVVVEKYSREIIRDNPS